MPIKFICDRPSCGKEIPEGERYNVGAFISKNDSYQPYFNPANHAGSIQLWCKDCAGQLFDLNTTYPQPLPDTPIEDIIREIVQDEVQSYNER